MDKNQIKEAVIKLCEYMKKFEIIYFTHLLFVLFLRKRNDTPT